ncbi:UNVERIFIED_CONTAM: hypothetical protein Sindi_2921100 [Sesamum indicum]
MRALTFYALAGGATGGTSNLPGGVTLRTGGATPRAAYAREARRRAPRRGQLGLPRWATFRGPNFDRFRWIPARFRSLAAFVMSRPWGLMGRYTGVGVRGTVREKRGSWTGGGSSFAKRGATRGLPRGSPILVLLSPSTLNFGVLMGSGALVLRSDRWDVESSGGRNFAHWWSYAASSLCTRSSPRAPRRGQLGLPRLGPHFVAQISPFSVDSGAFSIVGRIRDESAVGKSGKLDGWEEQFAKKGCNTRTSQGVTHPSTTLAQARLTSEFLMGFRCISAAERQVGRRIFRGGVTLRTGGATPASSLCNAKLAASSTTWTTGLAPLGHISWPKFRRFRWIPARFRSLAAFVMSRPWGLMGRYTGVGVRGTVEKKQEAGRVGGAVRKKGCNTRTSQGVTHPSTTLAQARLTSDGATGGTSNLPGGVTLRTGGATPRAAYAREARRELHDVDNWACPVGPHFVAQISPFSVDSGAFSIVGRIRDESAVGSHGEIYRGWGARNGREKAGSWTGGRSSSQKGVQHEDFPGGHPSYGATGGTSNLPGGVTLRTGGATPRAAYAREARRELHDVDNWACPVGPHFVAQISPFSVDSGAFSIVGRIRDESAVGSHGEIYRGWGARNGREKAGSWTGGGAVRKKGCNTRTSQGVTHPSTTLAQARLTSEF